HKEETSDGRATMEPAGDPSADDSKDALPSLPEAVRGVYHDLDDGDVKPNLTIRDENLTALFVGLERADRLEGLGEQATDALARDIEAPTSRTGVLGLLVRIGLSDVDESLIDAGKEGKALYDDDQRDAF
ncbi:MAG: hypothetical protein ACOCR0_02420, partial [Haloferacaceae archaeon]